MGPPLQSWRKEVRVFRNGIPCCTEMLTQVAEKAPKWTIGKRMQDPETMGNPTPGPLGVKGPDKFARDPVYSFPRGGPPDRPSSAPPGPRLLNPRLNPSTPKWGFGTNPRPSPFEPQPGPGAGNVRPPREGPHYSMPGRRRVPSKKTEDTPGPGNYFPRRPRSAYGPRWGVEKPGQQRPHRPPNRGPGPSYVPPAVCGRDGPSYSFRPNLQEKPDTDPRVLGPPWTYFGYNDFGRSDCSNCRDLPEFAVSEETRKAIEAVTGGRPYDASSFGNVAPVSTTSTADRTMSMKAKRPSSAPAGRAQRVPASGEF
jgi:hypothetical protein